MKTNLFVAMLVLILVGLMPGFAQAQVGDAALSYCEDLAFSTEEDFVTQGPEPPDGSPIISDGDLLGTGCAVCARSADLLGKLDVMLDLGLDAVDIIDVEAYLVAFSTELGYTSPLFTAGDLLVTNGAIIPNVALLNQTGVNPNLDLGLDAVHFKGSKTQIMAFLACVKTFSSLSNPNICFYLTFPIYMIKTHSPHFLHQRYYQSALELSSFAMLFTTTRKNIMQGT